MKHILHALCLFMLLLLSAQAFAETPPGYPSPGSGATGQPVTVALSIYKYTSWYRAEIQVDSVSSFSSKALRDTVIYGTDVRIGFLRFNKKYYWRARVYYNGDTSAWSVVWNFTTLSKPVPRGPANGSVTSGYLFWYYAGSPDYIAETDTSARFNSKLLQTIHFTDTLARRYSSDHLEYLSTDPGRTYYWHVKAVSGKDTSLWSDTWSFHTLTDSLVSPANGAKNVSDRPALNWTRMYAADTAEIQFDTTATFHSPVHKDTFLMTGYASGGDTLFKDLYFNKTYYWRIRQIHKGDTTAWRATYHFTTFAAPAPYSPTPGIYGIQLQPALFWQSLDYHNTYQYELDSTPGFKSPFDTSGYLSTDYTLTPWLKFEKTYYWRVKAINKKDTSDWSFTSTFHTESRTTAFGGTPYDKSENQPVTENLFWGWFGDPVVATVIRLDTTAAFRSKAARRDTVKTIPPQSYANLDESRLYYNTRYYWTMKYIYADDTSYTSPIKTFTTAAKPTLYYPSNKQPNLGVGTNLVTNTIHGSTTHIWQLDTSKSFNSPALRGGFSTTDSTVDPGGDFYFNKKYYWRFKEANEVDTSAWSDVWSFGSTDTMYLYAPKNLASNIATKPDLQWGGVIGARGYQYEVSTDPQFKGIKPVTINDPDVTDAMPQLHYNTHYYWRMRAYDKNDTSRWSLTWSFTTKAAPVIPAPTLVMPANKDTAVTIANGRVSCSWNNNGAAATKYEIQLATDNAFANMVYTAQALSTATSVSNATVSTTYFWRVRTYSDTLVSAWSSVFTFKTQDHSAVTEYAEADKHISVFPNPSDGVFYIKMPAHITASDVQLLDINGKKLGVYPQPGHDMIQIDAHGLKAGVYLLRIISGNDVFIRRVILE